MKVSGCDRLIILFCSYYYHLKCCCFLYFLENTKPKQPSTRQWAKNNDYNSKLLFEKLFNIDIEYLLKMSKLWESRRKPLPLTLEQLEDENFNCIPSSSSESFGDSVDKSLKDQKLWSLKQCYEKFSQSLDTLKKQLTLENYLVWDKDDESALDFVTAVSNLRSHCFGIERKSRFDVKSMAGNIIPAISSTNSIISGLITLQLLSLLRKLSNLDNPDQKSIDEKCRESCRCLFLRKVSLNARNLISSYDLFEPNDKCLVCSTGCLPEINISLNMSEVTMFDFVEQIIFKRLHFVCPDLSIDGTPTLIWSKEDADEWNEQEKTRYKIKPLNHYPYLKSKVRLRVDDLLQNYTVIINLQDEQVDSKINDGLFYLLEIVGSRTCLEPEKDLEEVAVEERAGKGKKRKEIDEVEIEEVPSRHNNEANSDPNHKEKNTCSPIAISDNENDEEIIEIDNDEEEENGVDDQVDVNSTENKEENDNVDVVVDDDDDDDDDECSFLGEFNNNTLLKVTELSEKRKVKEMEEIDLDSDNAAIKRRKV